jgi:iron complex outermembrane recepter protein
VKWNYPSCSVHAAVVAALGGAPFVVLAQDAEPPSAPTEEVLVSAQKREERLQDVPVPLSVLQASDLAEKNQVRLREYFSSVPGFNAMPNFAATQNLSIRGVTTGGLTTPTVGVTIDDVPFGASSGAHGNHIPDLDPSDLVRVELLRGPQGTLYGANSMGGLVKFVTIDPSFDEYSGRAEAGISNVHNGDGAGFNIRGSANIPLADVLAVRVSGFSRQDPGYIDNPSLNKSGVNEVEAEGARFSALWKPAEDMSLKLSALYQNINTGGLDEVVDSGTGSLEQNYIPGVGKLDSTIQAYSALFKAQLGGTELTSLTGYNVNETFNSLDFSFAFGGAVEAEYGPGVSGAPYYSNDEVRKFSQEVRLAVPIGSRIEWLVGGFYTRETDRSNFYVTGMDVSAGRDVAEYWRLTQLGDEADEYQETSAFTTITYQVTDRFDVQVGGRQSHIKSSLGSTIQTGPFIGAAPQIDPRAESSGDAFTYLLTPRFRVTPDFMVYARFASGYRPGTPNFDIPGVARQSNPDKTKTHEIGAKVDFLDRRLSVDGSIYYIDWSDIQIQLTDPGSRLVFNTNGSGAKSEGLELTVTAHPTSSLSLSAWAAYNNARLTEAFPANSNSFGVPGDKLPLSSRYSGHVSLQQEFPLWNDVTGFAGGVVSYVGERTGVFTNSADRQIFPDYTKTDLRAGIIYDSWRASFYVNNVTDERALINGGTGYFYPPAHIYITPRTLGLNVTKTF